MQQLFFDRAVWLFGTAVEADLNKASEKAKKSSQAQAARARVLAKWLNTGDVGFRKPEITR